MRQHRLGPGISFPAENFVPVDGEIIEKILLFGRSFFAKGWKPGFENLELAGMRPKDTGAD